MVDSLLMQPIEEFLLMMTVSKYKKVVQTTFGILLIAATTVACAKAKGPNSNQAKLNVPQTSNQTLVGGRAVSTQSVLNLQEGYVNGTMRIDWNTAPSVISEFDVLSCSISSNQCSAWAHITCDGNSCEPQAHSNKSDNTNGDLIGDVYMSDSAEDGSRAYSFVPYLNRGIDYSQQYVVIKALRDNPDSQIN